MRKLDNAPADMVQAAAEPAERATMATESFMAITTTMQRLFVFNNWFVNPNRLEGWLCCVLCLMCDVSYLFVRRSQQQDYSFVGWKMSGLCTWPPFARSAACIQIRRVDNSRGGRPRCALFAPTRQFDRKPSLGLLLVLQHHWFADFVSSSRNPGTCNPSEGLTLNSQLASDTLEFKQYDTKTNTATYCSNRNPINQSNTPSTR